MFLTILPQKKYYTINYLQHKTQVNATCDSSSRSGVDFISGGVQNIFGKVGVFAWRFAPCSAWRSHTFVRRGSHIGVLRGAKGALAPSPLKLVKV